jgi:hypothetical protein
MGVFRQNGELLLPARPGRSQVRIAVAMFFTFPEDARWNAERQAVEFGVEIGRVPRPGRRGIAAMWPSPAKIGANRHLISVESGR